MSISRFYEETLKAKCANRQWSWGAVDKTNNRVFLRVWKDEILKDSQGERVLVHWDKYGRDSLGDRERKRHLDAIKNGAEGYGVILNSAKNHPKGNRRIKSFDPTVLVKLGLMTREPEGIYSRIDGYVPTVNLLLKRPSSETIDDDITAIQTDTTIGPTTKTALVAARIGQGPFRDAILKNWGHKCAVTGSTTLKAIRASHIKPWRACSNTERLDPNNGIPLIANLDALFDVGLISFDRNGCIIVSPTMSESEVALFGLTTSALRRPPCAETMAYLEYHRANLFVK